jgi:hypothetical protein
LWADNQIDKYDKELADLFDELAVASVAPRPQPSVPSAALPRIRRMMEDTYTYWNARRKAPDVRIKHLISNTFARKTKTERVAFSVGQAVGAVATLASTAGGQAVDSSVKALVDAGYKGLDLGLAFGSTGVDAARDFAEGLAIDKVADKVAPAADVDDDTDLKTTQEAPSPQRRIATSSGRRHSTSTRPTSGRSGWTNWAR